MHEEDARQIRRKSWCAEQLEFVHRLCTKALVLSPFGVVVVFSVVAASARIFQPTAINLGFPRLLWKQRQFMAGRLDHGHIEVLFATFDVVVAIIVFLGVVRVLTGVFSSDAIRIAGERLEAWKSGGRSTLSFIFAALMLGPFATFASLNFEMAMSVDSLRSLSIAFPGGFVCLMAFMFCGGVLFSTEAGMALVYLVSWLIRTLNRQVARLPRREGAHGNG
ncbi:hypothetical protein [Rhodopseudomonas sp. BR0G17]|uniref:hypothetical protein n=1 Tax=Rhodopseudomonas sp. BR0G17 TaxID=2269368 RepID=UPI0013E009FA|nr:hypothetical protein [Rhodopseudomonas sp. BR0G17]